MPASSSKYRATCNTHAYTIKKSLGIKTNRLIIWLFSPPAHGLVNRGTVYALIGYIIKKGL